MKENIYVIFDRVANVAIKPPMVERNDVVPIRSLTQAALNNDSIIAKYPKEFELIQIGTLDMETLEVTQQEPRLVAVAVDLLPKE